MRMHSDLINHLIDKSLLLETVIAAPEAQNVLQTSMAGLAIFVVVLIFVISCRQCLMKPCGATKYVLDRKN